MKEINLYLIQLSVSIIENRYKDDSGEIIKRLTPTNIANVFNELKTKLGDLN